MSEEILICTADAVQEAAAGVRFAVRAGGEAAVGFVVRFQGQAFAYLNRCAHVPIELDWEKGQFFESGKRYIMCATHGAIYQPDSGQCVGGPCRGARLRSIAVLEKDGQIFWRPDDYCKAPLPSAETSA